MAIIPPPTASSSLEVLLSAPADTSRPDVGAAVVGEAVGNDVVGIRVGADDGAVGARVVGECVGAAESRATES